MCYSVAKLLKISAYVSCAKKVTIVILIVKIIIDIRVKVMYNILKINFL